MDMKKKDFGTLLAAEMRFLGNMKEINRRDKIQSETMREESSEEILQKSR
jgi:hypothetical protein